MNLRRDVFQALADPTRRSILLLVAARAMTAGAIAAKFTTARPTVSKHLQILIACELLEQEQNGREMYYRLRPDTMKEIAEFIEPFRALWEQRFDRLEAVMKKQPSSKKEPHGAKNNGKR
jgi:DNA-binding transcriptional ArsR family regulator